MTVGMQIRLWLRQAARGQIVATAVVVVAAVVLIAVSITSGTGSSRGSTANVSAGAPSGSLADTPGQAATTGDAGTGSAAGTATAGAGGAGATGGAAGAAGSAGTAAAPGGAAGGAKPGTTAAPGTPGAAPLTASDRGVTANSVKVEFLLANVGGLAASGFALGLRSDMEAVVKAYVDFQNKQGGINGRQIVYATRRTDPLQQSDQANACNVVEDQKPFAVLDTATLIYAATQQCFPQQKQTPFVHSYALSTAFENKSNGLDVTTPRTLDRVSAEWGSFAKTSGFLKGGEKVGIYTDKCDPSNGVLHNVLAPALKAAGAGEVVFGEVGCSPEEEESQTPNVVTQFKTANVTHVFPATAYVGVQLFTQQADTQLYHPKYLASDYDGMTLDLFAKNFAADQWDGTMAVTTGFGGYATDNKPRPERLKACSAMLTAEGLPGADATDKDSEAVGMCDNFFTFVAAAKLAGPNLTRTGWAQAVPKLGKIENAGTPFSVYGPGKFSGGEMVQTTQWRQDCKCYHSISDFRNGVA